MTGKASHGGSGSKAAKGAKGGSAGKSGGKSGGSRRGGRRRRGGGKGTYAQAVLTSHPTGRAAYTETRLWLLDQFGPVCAYCERLVSERTITLDHVTPRRGQTAYDRRDNLVLCCKTCNAAKADKPILAFLLGNRARVVALYKYGQHLSHQLTEMVKDLLPPGERPAIPTRRTDKSGKRRKTWSELHPHDHDDASPYL